MSQIEVAQIIEQIKQKITRTLAKVFCGIVKALAICD
jgi:hypothetical protein